MDEHADGLAKLYAKMATIMGSIERLPKDKYNKFQNYYYTGESAIADTLRKELAGQNIAFFVNLVDVIQTPKDKGFHTVATFEFTFACGDTGASITRRWIGEADDSLDKGINKASTLAMKFFLLRTFIMSTGDEADDPDSGNPPPPQKPKPAAAAPRPGTTPARPPQKPAEKPAPKPEPLDDSENVPDGRNAIGGYDNTHPAPATPAPQTPEQRRIPNGTEVDRTNRRNLKTAEIADLKQMVIAISPTVQVEPKSRQDFHAAGSIRKALGIENWAQVTIALDNEKEELAAIRARVQAYIEAEHVMTRALHPNAPYPGDEHAALKPAV